MSIKDLRHYIIEECNTKETVSLTEIIAKYDFHQHTIPSLNQIKRALEKIQGAVIKTHGNSISILMTDEAGLCNIEMLTEEHLINAYNDYSRLIK